tara:strand:- start:806 stop:1072 length:267 start_codon:yes stop_codon:yes gene_type:complete
LAQKKKSKGDNGMSAEVHKTTSITVLSERRQAYQEAIDLVDELSYLVDALYGLEELEDRMDQIKYVRNVQKRLTKALKPLVENNPYGE